MKLSSLSTRGLLAVIVAAMMPLAAAPVSAKSTSAVEKKEDNLAAAGFIVRPANTPDRIDMLKRLPANKFVQRTKDDVVTYVYADPKVCGCLYVGTQEAFGQYQKTMQAKKLLDQEAFNTLDYRDDAWNWGAWGAWGPRWGFGYLGW